MGSAAVTQAPGHRLYSPFGFGRGDTFLVDNTGTRLHTWPPAPTNRVSGTYLEPDGTLLRSSARVGSPSFGTGRGGVVERVAFDGTVQWQFVFDPAQYWIHHDVERLPNGNVLMIAWEILSRDDAEDAGRDPAFLVNSVWLPDAILEVQQTGPTTGDVVWEWHFMDHVIQDRFPTKVNFGVVADHPERLDINFPAELTVSGEWNHCNSLDYDPTRDLILVNSPFQQELYVIDHSTTSAEAAGHTGGNYGKGGDFVYRWGNPRAYRAGAAADQKLFFQHGAHFIPEGLPGAGNILLFNNDAGVRSGLLFSSVGEFVPPATFDLPPGEAWGPPDFSWEYTDAVPTAMYSQGMSNAVRLPNGNTLVDSGLQGWLFELDPTDQIVWQLFETTTAGNPVSVFQARYYERDLWADREATSVAAPANVRFDLRAGAPQRDRLYVMLGSANGTSPGVALGGATVPLNPDAYFRFTATVAGSALPSFLGVLDETGSATADLALPPLPGLAGLTLHHAFAVVDPTSMQVVRVSNPVSLRFEP
ncbi:MAG: aryl-sulfate sulfotransferase [Planctomycetota bacterium]